MATTETKIETKPETKEALATAETRIVELLQLERFQAQTVLLAHLIPLGTSPVIVVKLLEAHRARLAHIAKLSAEGADVRASRATGADKEVRWKATAGETVKTADDIHATIDRLAKWQAQGEKLEGGKAWPTPDSPIAQRVAAWALHVANKPAKEAKEAKES